MLIDSHCHLDFESFDTDRRDIIQRCATLGIDTIVVPGTQASSWQKIIGLGEQYTAIKFALGLHPYFLNHYQPQHLDQLCHYIDKYRDQLVALGEIGLDHAITVDYKLQLDVFQQQLNLANNFKLPLILHHRRSHNDLIQKLKKTKFSWGGIVHGFSGSLQEALTYENLGFKLGVGGVITYPRAGKTRNVIRQVPLELLVLETDAPDMPVRGKQGERNSPEMLPFILDELAILRQESPSLITLQCRKNVHSVLNNMDD